MPARQPPPPDDDPPFAGWETDQDTPVELSPEDLQEVAAAGRPPDAITPPRGVETLPGYDLGRRDAAREFFERWDYLLAEERRYGVVLALQALRDELARQKNSPAFVDEFVRRLAANVGVTLG